MSLDFPKRYSLWLPEWCSLWPPASTLTILWGKQIKNMSLSLPNEAPLGHTTPETKWANTSQTKNAKLSKLSVFFTLFAGQQKTINVKLPKLAFWWSANNKLKNPNLTKLVFSFLGGGILSRGGLVAQGSSLECPEIWFSLGFFNK